MIQRRTFIKQSGLALAATTILPSMVFSDSKKHAIGLQLYSLRETIGNDVAGTLKKVADIGFKEVETYGYSTENNFWGISVKDFKKMITDNGLTTPSGHYGVDPFLKAEGTEDDFAYNLDVANELGQEYVIIPYIGQDLRSSINDYKKLSDKLNTAGEMCKKAGLKLAYHNHDFEFTDYAGQNGLETFLANTDKNLVFFEMDIYWVVRAGQDPIALMNKYPKRFPLWHVKDMDKVNADLNTEIGNGSIDYKKI
ncbi:MAG: sugar phosphate isomerase/epimerase, partial [Leeuwenhoekiella sp.]